MYFQALDIWKAPSCATCGVDVRLSPLEYDDIISGLKEYGFETTVLIDDVQNLMDSQTQSRGFQDPSAGFNYSRYHQLNEVGKLYIL